MKIKLYDTECDVETRASGLWTVKNCFGEEIFTKLSTTHLNQIDTWRRHVNCLEYRLQLTPGSPAMDDLNEIGSAITPEIEKITNHSLLFAESKMWLDLSGWHCPYHADAEQLLVTYQVYLWCHGDVYGTEFCHGKSPIPLKFKANTGYINLNCDQKIHHSKTITGSRLSCCFQYIRKV